ncbi:MULTISPECIES: hypothetical protein [Acetobacter]|nr:MULTISPECIES: hypothetical protein [Acetobacter]GBR48805.1 hypothetical protein AA11825_1118 [Acetobacter pomorum DSM 11825]GCD54069.1 hypothetical protein NBRC3188_2766 [Acetobacter pasteurianus NBRC 3188]
MSDTKTMRRKAIISSLTFFLVAPLMGGFALVMGTLPMAMYVGPDFRQFDPATEAVLRIFGMAVLGIVGIILAAQRFATPIRQENTGGISVQS